MSIVERLRGLDTFGYQSQLACEAADLIEQQAKRIKELEASLASMVQGVKISIPTQTMEQEFQSHYRRGYEAGKAALRQRIADAPVVAWLHEVWRDSDVITDQVKHLWGRVPSAIGKEACYTIPLISKEDLQK